ERQTSNICCVRSLRRDPDLGAISDLSSVAVRRPGTLESDLTLLGLDQNERRYRRSPRQQLRCEEPGAVFRRIGGTRQPKLRCLDKRGRRDAPFSRGVQATPEPPNRRQNPESRGAE